MNTIEPGTPTQVAHPWKSVLRTLVAAGIGVVLAWLLRVLGLDLTGLEQPIVDSITNGAALAFTALFQWLLTRPALMPMWQALGLGTGVEDEPPKHRAV